MALTTRPDVVFLDLGDTLLRAHPSWPAIYRSVFPRFGIEATEEDLGRVLQSAPWDIDGAFEATEEASYTRVKAFDEHVMAGLGHNDLPDDFFRALEAAFDQASAWHIFPDVISALDRMRSAGVRLAVISNWVWGAPDLLHDLELASRFEALVISSRVGYQKPHEAIFQHALDAMQVPPERAIHVGDSYRADVLGARSVGMEAVLIDRNIGDPARLHANVPEGVSVPVIADLGDLLDLLALDRPRELRPVAEPVL